MDASCTNTIDELSAWCWLRDANGAETDDPVPVHDDAMAALLAAPDRSTVAGRRAVAVLSTLYDTGARVQELIDLELKNIRLRDPRSATLTGKGNKTRTVTITSKTADLVLAHLADRGIDPRDQPYLSTRAFCPPGKRP